MDRKSWIILALCGMLLVWNYQDQARKAQEAAKQQQEQLDKAPQSPAGEAAEKEQVAELEVKPPQPAEEEEIIELTALDVQTGEKTTVFTFTSRGGGVKTAEFLLQKEIDKSSTRNVFLNRFGAYPVGAIGRGADDFLGLTYALSQPAENKVVARAKTAAGLEISKTWTLNETDEPGQPYRLNLEVALTNQTAEEVNLGHYSVFAGAAGALYQREWDNQTGFFYNGNDSFEYTHVNRFKGGLFNSGLYTKPTSLIQESSESMVYAGVTNQYFSTVLTPAERYKSTIWAKESPFTLIEGEKEKKAARLGMSLPERKIGVGETQSVAFDVYMGPKEYQVLKQMDNDMSKIMHYGWFGVISRILSNGLNWLNGLFSGLGSGWSWGLAVICLTICIRTVIWPLHSKSTRTMKRMSKLQPIMKDLREKYSDNPNKLNQETMKLYREYNINPMGGCLPMFIQIPIFFGYYKMLQFAVELRGNSFLWVDDLSQPDTIYRFAETLPLIGGLPLNLLPILMAVTMVLQMRLTPTTGDKMQQRMMMFMPFMFFFFCYNFAAALALYWTTQNIFSIGQTWLMNKLPEPELSKKAKPAKAGGKKTFMERMAAKVEEAQKLQEQAKKAQSKASTQTSSTDKASKKKRGPKTGG
ncbi:membrane protein insertase YidC [Persicirhabdus sediminis]|uniref:Membrane protein insertase YidC n=1 Tax=Persicirhabdus sediminis TaxID=454144 RepID=A0A8J7MJZ9_9BACT|nr:membrane protein insertase YidC [Persicirhabdus sediminis]MBK1792403.1 membrane protein insertase YidC [Persicirhabdus sediminis]